MSRNRKIGYKAKTRFKKTMKRLIDGLSRKIIIYLQDTEAECPNCYYDKVNRKSSGVSKVDSADPNYFIVGRCPVCLGKGVIITRVRRCIEGIVNWDPSDNSLTFTSAGYEGATIVQIKTDPCHLDTIKNSQFAVINGITCKLTNPPIVRGVGNSAVVIANFFTTTKQSPDSGEVL